MYQLITNHMHKLPFKDPRNSIPVSPVAALVSLGAMVAAGGWMYAMAHFAFSFN
jgi:hypothetical protein